ncbi:MAG: hypothetical protein WCC21_09830 [Candidatus Acidiferrales bacterium]
MLVLVFSFLSGSIPTRSQEPTASHPASAAEASKYPDTKAGLQQFLNDISETARDDDSQKLGMLVKSMEIPNCDAWLHTMYESEKADSWMSQCDARTLRTNEQSLIERFNGLAKADGEFIVRQVNDDPEPGRGLEWGWLQAIRRPLDIYFVTWKPEERPTTEPIGYFLFVDGGFRWDSAIQFLQLIPIRATGVQSLTAGGNRLFAARAQYYTPTANGLKSFHCEATIDWKAMLKRFSGAEIPEDNPALKYLQTVHLSVVDQLTGKGSMEWIDTGTPPEGQQANLKQMRDGLQTMIGGFFQSWNAYVNGSMVPFPDKTIDVTTEGVKTHLHGASTNMTFDEDYDENMLLTQAVVETSELKVVAVPTYVRTDDGLVVVAVTSQVNQPPAAPALGVTFRVQYTKVDSFQIPSHVVYDIKNIGVIEVAFSACQATVADSPQEPAAEKLRNPTD